MKKTLADAIKGMQVKSWEVREHSDGKRAVYVHLKDNDSEYLSSLADDACSAISAAYALRDR